MARDGYHPQPRLAQLQALLAVDQAEPNEIRPRGRFDPHELSAQAHADLNDQHQALGGIRWANVVRKRVQHLPEQACFGLAYPVSGLFPWQHRAGTAAVDEKLNDAPAP